MSAAGLSSADVFLLNAGERYFRKAYVNPKMRRNQPLEKVGWAPSLQVEVHEHHMIICEASADKPYPQMLALRGHEVMQVQMPISVYCICAEAEFLRSEHQDDVRKLISHGFGLLTVDKSGNAMVRHSTIPLVQRISDDVFGSEIRGLPLALRRRLAQCFESYKKNAGSGVHELAELIEGVTYRGGTDSVKKGWVDAKEVRPGNSADTLDALHKCKQFADMRAELGAARGFIASARNPASHYPKNKKQAFQKYHNCRDNFVLGLKIIKNLHDALIRHSCSGALPKI